jgi:hypothetical protein
MSAALVLRLQDILTVPGINWKYETLYVPCLVPFVIASLLCIAVNRRHMQSRWYEPLAVAWRKTIGAYTPVYRQTVSTCDLAAGQYLAGDQMEVVCVKSEYNCY